MAKDTTTGGSSRRRRAAADRAPLPMPPGLADQGGEMPAAEQRPFVFGALLMRVGDDGAVHTDMVAGYAYGHAQPQAQADFVTNVRRSYPGHSITKVTGQEVLPADAAG